MYKVARVTGVALAVLVLSLGAGCRKKAKKEETAQAARAAARKVPVPKQLLAYVGLKSPGKTIDQGLALVQKFAALPFTRETLLDMLAQQAQLPRGLMTAVDVERTFWMLGLDEKQVGTGDPSVVVFPIKSKKEFEAALGQRMKKGQADGDLVSYEPKPGQLGVQKIALVIGDEHVYFPSSKKALKASRAFIEAALLRRQPTHDVEVHVLMEQILSTHGDELDKEIARTVDKMKNNMARGAKKGPVDQKPMADATGKVFERWAEYLKGTKELEISMDISAEDLILTARGEALPGKSLHKVIKRQRTGKPVGLDRLPASSWLVMADHGNPEATRENAGTWKPAMDEMFKEVDPKVREKLTSVFTKLSEMSTGDFTTAFHRAPSGAGLSISGLGTMKDSSKAKEEVDGVIDAVGVWLKAEMKKSGEKMPEGLELKRQDFAHEGAKGTMLKLSVPFPKGKEKERALLTSLAGMPMTMGWAFSDKEMFFSLGKEAEAQLKLMIEGKVKGKSLADKADFAAAMGRGKERVGLVYLSLVDLLRWFKGTEVEKMMPPALQADLKDAPASPSLSWGVNGERTAMDLSLHLPASHFLVFKPMLETLMKSGGLPAEALLGGSRKGL